MDLVLGAVSNCWGALLPGSSLEAQCRAAVERGFGYVELRQRALGACEEKVGDDPRPWPLPQRLAELRAAFPELGMNLALEAPFLADRMDPDAPYFARCAEAALALSPEQPILRFVDLTPVKAVLEHDEAIDEIAGSVADLTVRLGRRGVAVALENSLQPMASLRAVIEAASHRLPDSVPRPLICWDPVNQLQVCIRPEDPMATAAEIPFDELFMFHFKQCRERKPIGDMGEGDVDWPALLAVMARRGYSGPALFELPGGPDAWERLDSGTAAVRSWLAQLA